MPEFLPYPQSPVITPDPPPADLLALVEIIRGTVTDPGHLNRYDIWKLVYGREFVFPEAEGGVNRPPTSPHPPHGGVYIPEDEGDGTYRPNSLQPLGTPASGAYNWQGEIIQAWWVSYDNWIAGDVRPLVIFWDNWPELVTTDGGFGGFGGAPPLAMAYGCPIWPYPYPYPGMPKTQDEVYIWHWRIFGRPPEIMTGAKLSMTNLIALGLLSLLSLSKDMFPVKIRRAAFGT